MTYSAINSPHKDQITDTAMSLQSVSSRTETRGFSKIVMMPVNLALLILVSALILPTPASALLNGDAVQSRPDSPYVMLSQRIGNEVFDCSGVFVSKNTILTAAHCFKELINTCYSIDDCSQVGKNAYRAKPSQRQDLSVNYGNIGTYTVIHHPNYYDKESSEDTYTLQTNHDLALVVLKDPSSKQKYVPVGIGPIKKGDQLWSYSIGMSELKLKTQSNINDVYNEEDGFGTLKRAPFSVSSANNGELLESKSVMIGRKTASKEYSMKPVRGAQILGSDSGGALVKSGKVVGIVRNYELSFTIKELGRVQKGLQKTFTMRGKSVFTSLQSKKNRQFLLSAKKFGGKVFFNN